MKTAKGPPFPCKPNREAFPSRELGETLALRALAFLAQDLDRIERFFRSTGLDPGDVRAAAGEVGFQLAVLDHLAADEALLLDFTTQEGLSPQTVGLARRALGGGDE